jgi:hypothetical protein
MVTVYGYKRWDDRSGKHVLMRSKATVDALVRMTGCTPVEGSGEEVPGSAVTEDGLYEPKERLPASDSGPVGSSRPDIPQPQNFDLGRLKNL